MSVKSETKKWIDKKTVGSVVIGGLALGAVIVGIRMMPVNKLTQPLKTVAENAK